MPPLAFFNTRSHTSKYITAILSATTACSPLSFTLSSSKSEHRKLIKQSIILPGLKSFSINSSSVISSSLSLNPRVVFVSLIFPSSCCFLASSDAFSFSIRADSMASNNISRRLFASSVCTSFRINAASAFGNSEGANAPETTISEYTPNLSDLGDICLADSLARIIWYNKSHDGTTSLNSISSHNCAAALSTSSMSAFGT
mmetsp:Transcript_8361/g.26771  ORF Transcript_8361/g.26771 Transcript_8361/m.26771 type:complete len:201 (+) Transcript_8361:2187-2789(+)